MPAVDVDRHHGETRTFAGRPARNVADHERGLGTAGSRLTYVALNVGGRPDHHAGVPNQARRRGPESDHGSSGTCGHDGDAGGSTYSSSSDTGVIAWSVDVDLRSSTLDPTAAALTAGGLRPSDCGVQTASAGPATRAPTAR